MATYPVIESTVYTKRRGESVRSKIARHAPSPVELLDERVFVHMLRLERKRCERSHEPFVLMLFDVSSLVQGGAFAVIAEVARGIVSSTRETDILGWYEQGKILGLIVSQIGNPALSNSGLVAERVGQTLQESLAPETFATLKMRVRI